MDWWHEHTSGQETGAGHWSHYQPSYSQRSRVIIKKSGQVSLACNSPTCQITLAKKTDIVFQLRQVCSNMIHRAPSNGLSHPVTRQTTIDLQPYTVFTYAVFEHPRCLSISSRTCEVWWLPNIKGRRLWRPCNGTAPWPASAWHFWKDPASISQKPATRPLSSASWSLEQIKGIGYNFLWNTWHQPTRLLQAHIYAKKSYVQICFYGRIWHTTAMAATSARFLEVTVPSVFFTLRWLRLKCFTERLSSGAKFPCRNQRCSCPFQWMNHHCGANLGVVQKDARKEGFEGASLPSKTFAYLQCYQ